MPADPHRCAVRTARIGGAHYDRLSAARTRVSTRGRRRRSRPRCTSHRGLTYGIPPVAECVARVVRRVGTKLLLRADPTLGKRPVVHELVRALIDQNFNLADSDGLRLRDRDRALAAYAIVDGTAALASSTSATCCAPSGSAARRRFVLRWDDVEEAINAWRNAVTSRSCILFLNLRFSSAGCSRFAAPNPEKRVVSASPRRVNSSAFFPF
jgi:hypothetical protein